MFLENCSHLANACDMDVITTHVIITHVGWRVLEAWRVEGNRFGASKVAGRSYRVCNRSIGKGKG